MNLSSESNITPHQSLVPTQQRTAAEVERVLKMYRSQKIVLTLERAIRCEAENDSPSLLIYQAFTELFAAFPPPRPHELPFTASNGVRISFHLSPGDDEIYAELAAGK